MGQGAPLELPVGHLDPAATTADLAALAAACHACDLYRDATQVVFGAGPALAALMLMGEQPGHKEDIAGAPFVGPAGRVLDDALHEAGIERGDVYVTNAVKHFKFERHGKLRLHKKPDAGQVRACRPWWQAELEVVQPRVLCCLGATAAQAVFGRSFRVTREHGRLRPLEQGPLATATIHPSAVLRAKGPERDTMLRGMIDDLAALAPHLG